MVKYLNMLRPSQFSVKFLLNTMFKVLPWSKPLKDAHRIAKSEDPD